MNTFSDSVLTALHLITSFDNALWVVVIRSLAVSATACLLAYGVGVALGAWLAVSRLPTSQRYPRSRANDRRR